MDITTFRTRLRSLALKAISTDPTTFPRISSSSSTIEQHTAQCVGQVLTSLCTGTPRNLTTPEAAAIPTSMAALRAALRWSMSYIGDMSLFEQLYSDIQTDADYVEDLFNHFQPINYTALVGTIASIGIFQGYTDPDTTSQALATWAYSVSCNILAFCAAHDIDPFE